MRAYTPETYPDFDGKSFNAAGLGHWLGLLFGLMTFCTLVCGGKGELNFATEKRWTVASLGLLSSAAVLAACQTATVGPMQIGVSALEHPEGKAIQILGLLVAVGVFCVGRNKAFGWIDGLAITGMLCAMIGAGLLHTTDIVLQGTQIPASQLLSLALPAMALVSLWPIEACCKSDEEQAEA
jgi:hypothetical protein